METADVVIVGGGIVGCSIAFHLAERRAGRIILLERGQLGAGTTAKGSGGVRLQFSTAVNIQLSLQAVPFFEGFQERFGVDPEYQQRGYLFLAHDEDLMGQFRRNLALQQEYGVPSREVSPDDIRELVPYVNVDDVVGGTYCAKDGRANPKKLLAVFSDEARAMGAEIREWTAVLDLRRDGDRVTGVRTALGEIESPVVVNACGPWAAALSAMAGVDEPITPFRRQQFLTEPTDLVPRPTPFVIDGDRSFSFHSLGDQVRVGMAQPGETSNWNDQPDWDLVPLIRERLAHRAPILGDLPIVGGYAGLYEMSPDAHAIIGWAPGASGLLLCNGFSGHGLMHSPITGKLAAEIILDGRAHTVDISSLRPSRFAEGAAIEEGLAII
jgi:sarcosine oxidase, subunit beta